MLDKMREYKIYKTSLWWSIYRKKQIWKMLMVQYLNWHDLWTLNKNHARVFYNEDSAVSALSIVKARNGKDAD